MYYQKLDTQRKVLVMTRTVTGPGIAPCAAAAAGSGSSYYSPAILKTLGKLSPLPTQLIQGIYLQ